MSFYKNDYTTKGEDLEEAQDEKSDDVDEEDDISDERMRPSKKIAIPSDWVTDMYHELKRYAHDQAIFIFDHENFSPESLSSFLERHDVSAHNYI